MSFFTAMVSSKIAAGLLAGGTIAAGGAAAAYTGVLPAPLQQGSHELINAPAPGQMKAADAPETDSDAAGGGPDATGPAAFGLCTAFTNGGLNSASTAYKSLEAAAGGGGIADYCKSVPAPGESAKHRPDAPGNPDKPDKPDKPGKPESQENRDSQENPDADPSSTQRTTPDQAREGQVSKAQASKSQPATAQASKGASHRPAAAGEP
ncbi:hypothetical protein [Arthrobacter sp. C152]